MDVDDVDAGRQAAGGADARLFLGQLLGLRDGEESRLGGKGASNYSYVETKHWVTLGVLMTANAQRRVLLEIYSTCPKIGWNLYSRKYYCN